MSGTQPDYYKILEILPSASQQEIRDAYKKSALKWHPDRVPSDSPERATRTARFQAINDAYFTLSDPTRRRTYDATRPAPSSSTSYATDPAEEEIPPSGSGAGFSFPGSSFFGFGNRASAAEEPTADAQFGSVFEEMLRDEGLAEGSDARPTGKFWSLVGAASGATMGFIVANAAGAVAGGVAGNRLGAVRDKRGKSVYAVYQELPQADKARLLAEMAAKVFGYAVSA